jgi:hypothetical protein
MEAIYISYFSRPCDKISDINNLRRKVLFFSRYRRVSSSNHSVEGRKSREFYMKAVRKERGREREREKERERERNWGPYITFKGPLLPVTYFFQPTSQK